MGADIAQWIHLLLPFYHPGFESQAHIATFVQHLSCEKNLNKQKEAGLGPF